MDIQLQKKKGYKITRGNMVIGYKINGSTLYKKAKLMCIMSMKQRKYYNLPFDTHIRDIEQTLIDYGIRDEKFFIALWVANCDIPFRKRIEMFGKGIVKLAFGFNRNNINKGLNSITKSEIARVNKDIITLHLAQRVTNINFAINNVDKVSFNMYVKAYPEYKEALKQEIPEHEKMWNYLKLTCEDAKTIDALYHYL